MPLKKSRNSADKSKPAAVSEKSVSSSSVKRKPFPIVGMGGSAGSFSSFEKFFKHMPADSGMAFVIIMHLDPNHKGNLAELIQNYTSMPVAEAADGMGIRPDNVYIIPPNKDLGIHNTKLLLLNFSKARGYRLPVDYFLQSLAEDQWSKAVAIIFSGMGSDGETGVRMIKEKLGMVMVQDPLSAEYDSMPQASIATNLVDYVLSPEEMPVRLIQYMHHPSISDLDDDRTRTQLRDANAMQKIFMLLRTHTGQDFSMYKKSTVYRRIDRRVAFHQLTDYSDYVNFLRENPGEVEILFKELLIGVTKFFRDPAAFASLSSRLSTALLNKTEGPLRVWVAGCSTGEEAYSIAMLLLELVGASEKQVPKIQIFATDLDNEAIEHARAGNYYGNIVADVSPERLERFFTKKEEYYSVNKELRQIIVFARHNIIKDAPFTRLDLLCCRNLLIYLDAELQQKIIPVFNYVLNPKGILFLGPAETINGFITMFSSVDPKWKLFERTPDNEGTSRMIDFPFHVSGQTGERLYQEERRSKKKTLTENFKQLMLESYTPPSILFNEKGEILYINGKTGKYLELPPGEANMNIYHMAREELRYVLINAVRKAKEKPDTIIVDDIKFKEDKQVHIIQMQTCVLQHNSLDGLILVVFDDKGIYKKSDNKSGRQSGENLLVKELETELLYTKQQLHSTILQMEASLEELKSSNEELQSTNEELQSTNEESLTTKEEMQSLNEELMTINMQYQNKAEELTQLNNDMKNLLDATEIGTIFLNNNLEILRFTPQVKKLFNVIPADIGRPISHVVSKFEYSGLENDIHEVIEKLVVKEKEIKTTNGEWYGIRIIPYRTLDNFISGAVLTFNVITASKALEQKLRSGQEYAGLILNAIDSLAILLDDKWNIIIANRLFLQTSGLKETDIEGVPFQKLMKSNFKLKDISKLLGKTHAELKTSILLKHNKKKMVYKIEVRQLSISEQIPEPLILVTMEEDLSNE
jgi:two-component system CheB/CheR fusion protein